MKQIHTREQLEAEIASIIFSTNDCEGMSLIDSQVKEAVTQICDLIASLNGDHCFHSKESDDRR